MNGFPGYLINDGGQMNECGVEGVWLDGDCCYRLGGDSSLITHTVQRSEGKERGSHVVI